MLTMQHVLQEAAVPGLVAAFVFFTRGPSLRTSPLYTRHVSVLYEFFLNFGPASMVSSRVIA